jgi:hypothetical protein
MVDTSTHALLNERPLELGHGADDVKDHSPGWRARRGIVRDRNA